MERGAMEQASEQKSEQASEKKPVKKVAKKAAKKAVKKVAKKDTKKAVKKVAKKAPKKVVKKVSKKAPKKRGIKVKGIRNAVSKILCSDFKIDLPHMMGRGLGLMLGGTARAIDWFSGTAKQTAGIAKRLSVRERIRSVVLEELGHLLSEDQEIPLSDLEERFRIMAEAIHALQKKVTELAASGPVSDSDMRKAVDSLKVAQSLSEAERTILVSVFRQNVAIQKPDVEDAG
jgi:antitoxin component HigA of HigAB toxin-antitoxin module